MEFCQSVFANDEYKYFLDDSPCPHVGIIGCEESTRSAIMNAFAGPQYRPPRVRLSSYGGVSHVYTKKSGVPSRNLSGVMKLGWWKKHQEKVLGCAVLLVDWDAIKTQDRIAFETIMQKHLDGIKAHLKVPYASNTKIIIGLVCSAKGLEDPSPCGFYTSIEDAQSSLRSRLGLSDRNLLALYQRGMDQYSVQRLENMAMEQVFKYHKDEIARLRKAKGESNETAAHSSAVAAQDGAPQTMHTAQPAMESVFIARNRFKMAWHATVSKDIKLARRSWEKCYNALHSLPAPLSTDRWVVATIALWKLISDNFQKFNDVTIREVPDAGASIETDIQAFLIHLNWVQDCSFVYHGSSTSTDSTKLVPRIGEPTPALVLNMLSDAESLHVIVREWFLADFYTIVANRLEQLKGFLPKAGVHPLGSRMICLPAYHLQCAVKSLSRVRDIMVHLLSKRIETPPSGVLGALIAERVRPEAPAVFVGREGSDVGNLMPFLTTISLADLVGRMKSNLYTSINWFHSYGLSQLCSTLQLELAEYELFLGHFGEAIQTLNRLMTDNKVMQWKDIRLAVHEVRYKATSAQIAGGPVNGGKSLSQGSETRERAPSAIDAYYSTPEGIAATHHDMIASLLYLLFHSSNNASKAQRLKADLHEFESEFLKPACPLLSVDVTPLTFAGRVEGSSERGTIGKNGGTRLCNVTIEDAIIFPLLKVFVHFTVPFVESWKGSADGEERKRTSGLTFSIECNATTPLRLYNVELQLFRITRDSENRKRKRELVPHPIRLCWFGTCKPTYYIEVSNKSPVWSTTIHALPFLTGLDEGTYECGFMKACVFVSQSNVSSIHASVGFDQSDENRAETFDNSARRRSVASGDNSPKASKYTDFSGSRSTYSSLSAQGFEASHTSIPIHYDFTAAIEDDYVALFEDFCFDSAENRVHLFLTSQAHQSRGTVPALSPLATARNKARSTSFSYPTVAQASSAQINQRAASAVVSKQSTGSNSSLAAYANILLLEGHRFGIGSSPGCYYSHLHRPIVRLTKPVTKMVMESIVPAGQHVLEGDDYVVPLALESRGDTLLNGRLLIPYIEDVVELVQVKTSADEIIEMADVTGTSAAIIAATPVGYRVAEIKLKPRCIMPVGPSRRLLLCIRLRCSYAGFFELPVRLDYATPKCQTMTLLHMLRVHVCRPFICSFKLYDVHVLNGQGGRSALLGVGGNSPPDINNQDLLTVIQSAAKPSSDGGFDPFTMCTNSTALPDGTHDLLLSEFMSICHGERQELLTLHALSELQKAFDRDSRMANIIVNLAAQRLIKAHEAAKSMKSNQPLATIRFYHVDKVISANQTIQAAPEKFHLHQNSPFVVRACFINTIRCPVRLDRLEVQLSEGVFASFHSNPPPVQVLLPGEEITFALQLRCSRVLSIDDSMGRVLLHVRRVTEANGRSVEPTVASLCGGGLNLKFAFNFPRVPVVEQIYTCQASYPTTLFVGEPFSLRIAVTNTSAVPSKKLRLHFSGHSLDRHFLLTGRAQTSFAVPGLGSTTITVSMIPLVAGAFNLPSFELVSDDDVLARSQDIHTVEVLPTLSRQ